MNLQRAFLLLFTGLFLTSAPSFVQRDKSKSDHALKQYLLRPLIQELTLGYEFSPSRFANFNVSLGGNYRSWYNENHGLPRFRMTSSRGFTGSLSYHVNVLPSLPFANIGLGAGIWYTYKELRGITRVYEWSWRADGDDEYPSTLYPYETQVCDECTAKLNEYRNFFNPRLFTIVRTKFDSCFQLEFQPAFGLRFAKTYYEILETSDGPYNGNILSSYLIYPTIHLDLNLILAL